MIGVYLTKTGQLRAVSGSPDERNALSLSIAFPEQRVITIYFKRQAAARISYDRASGVIESISSEKAGDAVEVIIA
ncbi:MAG: hypothetical protein WC693_02310 [Patescibacteria group bacterium]|jgi:hypothetical protein